MQQNSASVSSLKFNPILFLYLNRKHGMANYA